MRLPTRRDLAHEALLASISVRKSENLGFDRPLDIYALCDSLGVSVRFVEYSMEGLYAGGSPPTILLSALRPLARRAFTCAHELGHHVFGHGATVDKIIEELHATTTFQPDEFLVQAFAGYLLMPTLGVRKAFATRGWVATMATPAQLFTIACSFGVGYGTLINHLAYSLKMLTHAQAQRLQKVSLDRVRRDVLGFTSSSPLLVVDHHWLLPTLDAEVGTLILLPSDATVEGELLSWQSDIPSGRLFVATKPGISRVVCSDAGVAIFVRASRYQYVGLCRHRHVEEADDDEGTGDG